MPFNPSLARIFGCCMRIVDIKTIWYGFVMDKEIIKSKILSEIERNVFRAQIEKVSLFGSYLSNSHKSDSDVDVLVEFKPNAKIGFFELSQLQDELKQALNTEVDLVTPGALSEYFRSEVLSKAELVYEGK